MVPGFSQDRLFTQAFAHPSDLNPAYAGAIEGRYRVSLAYRDQWRSIVESPFTTIGLFGDVKITLENRGMIFLVPDLQSPQTVQLSSM